MKRKFLVLILVISLIFSIFTFIPRTYSQNTLPDTVIQLSDQSNLPLEHSVIPGKPKTGFCDTGANKSTEWNLSSGNVDRDPCNDTDSKSIICPDADMAKDDVAGNVTPSVALCYWKNQKKVRMFLDSSKMENGGCYIHKDQAHLNEPGGYGNVFTWTSGGSNQFFTNRSLYMLDNLQELRVQANTQVDGYGSVPCPASSPIDPVYGNKNPNALGTLSYAVTEIDDSQNVAATYFITFTVFNTLPDKATTQPSITCNFGNLGAVTVNAAFNIISFPGAKYTEVGSPQSYDINVLDAFKQVFTTCKNDPNFKGSRNYDLKKFYLTLIFNSMETWNGSKLDYSISNYKTVLKYKVSPTILPFGMSDTQITSCRTIKGWAWDPKIPDYGVNIHVYEGDKLVGTALTNVNQPETNAATGGNGPRGFEFRVPQSLKDGKIHSLNMYALNSGTGGNYSMNLGKAVSFQCSCGLADKYSDKFDLNSNCTFSADDLSIFLSDMNKWSSGSYTIVPLAPCGAYELRSDVNGDCKVAMNDLSLFLFNYQSYKSGN